MILQALYEYYQRKTGDAENSGESLAPSGWEMKAFPFILVLDTEGKLVAIEDMRPAEKHGQTKAWPVPQGTKKTSGVAANLLWDNIEYVLGYVPESKKPTRIAKQHSTFIDKIEKTFPDYEKDDGIKAVLLFLRNNPLDAAKKIRNWREKVIKTNGANLTFRLAGSDTLVCQSEYVKNIVNNLNQVSPTDKKGYCLITGNKTKIASTHPAIKGVSGTQSSGGNIISFNQDSFISYGKKQGENAPVSEEAANYYTTALNHLLSKSSGQRIDIGNTTTITWWAERQFTLESDVDLWFWQKDRDDPDKRSSSIKELLDSPRKGVNYKDSQNTKFYILGLAPNAARIAIRFFRVATVEEFAEKIRKYFEEIRLPYFDKNHFPPLPSLCEALASDGDLARLPPNFQGAVFESIISGQSYPKLFFFTALRRIRAKQNITTNLAAIIKACLIRNFKKEVQMSLDINNHEPGYLLGRLFAVYDKLKEDETGKPSNRRDRFMSAFMTRPQTVLSQLERLSNCDLKKLRRSKPGLAINHEKKIQEIIDLMNGKESIPPLLNNEQQALFVLGYYHQRQALFEKKQEETLSNVA